MAKQKSSVEIINRVDPKRCPELGDRLRYSENGPTEEWSPELQERRLKHAARVAKLMGEKLRSNAGTDK